LKDPYFFPLAPANLPNSSPHSFLLRAMTFLSLLFGCARLSFRQYGRRLFCLSPSLASTLLHFLVLFLLYVFRKSIVFVDSLPGQCFSFGYRFPLLFGLLFHCLSIPCLPFYCKLCFPFAFDCLSIGLRIPPSPFPFPCILPSWRTFSPGKGAPLPPLIIGHF